MHQSLTSYRLPHYFALSAAARSLSRSRSRSPARGGGGGGGGGGGDGDWRDELERLYDKGTLRKGDLDERIMSDLEGMRPEEAACVLQRISESDMSRVRNISGFVGGIIRRVKTDGPDKGEAKLDLLPKSVQRALDDLVADVSPLENDSKQAAL